MSKKVKVIPPPTPADPAVIPPTPGAGDGASSNVPASGGATPPADPEGTPPNEGARKKAASPRADISEIKNLIAGKYLERRIGLSVRVVKPGVPFSMQTPAGVVTGEADQFVVQRQDGSRVVVSADELADGFQFLR